MKGVGTPKNNLPVQAKNRHIDKILVNHRRLNIGQVSKKRNLLSYSRSKRQRVSSTHGDHPRRKIKVSPTAHNFHQLNQLENVKLKVQRPLYSKQRTNLPTNLMIRVTKGSITEVISTATLNISNSVKNSQL